MRLLSRDGKVVAMKSIDVRDIEATLKALADGTRLRILGLLSEGEVCVCSLHESLDLPQPMVSRHLGHLRRAGLVDTRKKGLWVYYRLTAPATPIVDLLLSPLRQCLEHLPTAERDRRRLRKRMSCSVSRSAGSRPGM